MRVCVRERVRVLISAPTQVRLQLDLPFDLAGGDFEDALKDCVVRALAQTPAEEVSVRHRSVLEPWFVLR